MVKHVVDDETKENNINFILAGDFNIVQDNNLDIISGEPHNEIIVNSFKEMINDLLLVDVWRLSHGNRKEFTWSRNNPFVARRLDYIFISEPMFPFCQDSSIENFGFSDHRGAIINLDFTCFKRGPSYYKFNNTLLKNINFINEVTTEICRIKSLNLDPHLCWEYIKVSTIKSYWTVIRACICTAKT